MPTGPQRLILIRSGCYEYAEIELTCALQIVGPNNTGKTALIKALTGIDADRLDTRVLLPKSIQLCSIRVSWGDW